MSNHNCKQEIFYDPIDNELSIWEYYPKKEIVLKHWKVTLQDKSGYSLLPPEYWELEYIGRL